MAEEVVPVGRGGWVGKFIVGRSTATLVDGEQGERDEGCCCRHDEGRARGGG